MSRQSPSVLVTHGLIVHTLLSEWISKIVCRRLWGDGFCEWRYASSWTGSRCKQNGTITMRRGTAPSPPPPPTPAPLRLGQRGLRCESPLDLSETSGSLTGHGKCTVTPRDLYSGSRYTSITRCRSDGIFKSRIHRLHGKWSERGTPRLSLTLDVDFSSSLFETKWLSLLVSTFTRGLDPTRSEDGNSLHSGESLVRKVYVSTSFCSWYFEYSRQERSSQLMYTRYSTRIRVIG